MTMIEYYRLTDDSNECRYMGTFDHQKNEGGRRQTADALARCGVSEEVAQKVIHLLSYDYHQIDRKLPICCAEHERFLNSLIEASTSGSPVQLGPQHQPGHPIDQGRSGPPAFRSR